MSEFLIMIFHVFLKDLFKLSTPFRSRLHVSHQETSNTFQNPPASHESCWREPAPVLTRLCGSAMCWGEPDQAGSVIMFVRCVVSSLFRFWCGHAWMPLGTTGFNSLAHFGCSGWGSKTEPKLRMFLLAAFLGPWCLSHFSYCALSCIGFHGGLWK